MTVTNYIPFLEFSTSYPVINHSSRVYRDIVKEFPEFSDEQNYVERTYLAENYLTAIILDTALLNIIANYIPHTTENYIDPTYILEDFVL